MAYSLLTCSSQAITCLSYRTSFLAVTCCLCRDMPLQKLSGSGHFCVLTGMCIFQSITLHRTPNSLKSRNKIRLAFHFVERKKAVLPWYSHFWKHGFFRGFAVQISVASSIALFRSLIKPRSRRLSGFLLCLRSNFFFFLSVTISKPPRMMSSSANYRPFLSSFRHIPPQEHFVTLAN